MSADYPEADLRYVEHLCRRAKSSTTQLFDLPLDADLEDLCYRCFVVL